MTIPIRVDNGFRIIAHRGASAYAPENTLAAFVQAERMGAREVELDVQFSADRHLMICHDRMLDRYGHPGLSLSELPLIELQALDMGAWFSSGLFPHEKMLTLGELFSHFGDRFIYHVEIKDPTPGIAGAVLSMIEAHGLQAQIFITSFHQQVLGVVKALSPLTRVGWLVKEGGLSSDNVCHAVEIGCHQICPRASTLTAEQVAKAHQTLPEVRAFGVKSLADAQRVVGTGCDGLTVDDPGWLVHKQS